MKPSCPSPHTHGFCCFACFTCRPLCATLVCHMRVPARRETWVPHDHTKGPAEGFSQNLLSRARDWMGPAVRTESPEPPLLPVGPPSSLLIVKYNQWCVSVTIPSNEGGRLA